MCVSVIIVLAVTGLLFLGVLIKTRGKPNQLSVLGKITSEASSPLPAEYVSIPQDAVDDNSFCGRIACVESRGGIETFVWRDRARSFQALSKIGVVRFFGNPVKPVPFEPDAMYPSGGLASVYKSNVGTHCAISKEAWRDIYHHPGAFNLSERNNLIPNNDARGERENAYDWARDQIRSIKPIVRLWVGYALLLLGAGLLWIGFWGDTWGRLILFLLLSYIGLLGAAAFLGSWAVYG